MSKKKTLSTMSLKDFHGGSIPSDLPLPSAPGLVVSSGSERNMSTNWGNNLVKSDLRPRPKSSGTARNFGEKASFLSHPAPIGQNFDEDERKPMNSAVAPNRAIRDDSVRNMPSIQYEMKLDYVSSVRTSDRSVSSPSSVTNSSPLRVGGGNHFTVNSPTPISNSGQGINNLNFPSTNNDLGVNNSQPNAWGVRKDLMAVEEIVKPSVLNGPDALSKIAQASALEKVSSGMWQSKKPGQLLPHLLNSSDNNNNVSGVVDVISERAKNGTSQGSQVVAGQIVEDGTKGGLRELPKTYIQEVRTGATSGESLLSAAPPLEKSDRPKLKLLPRSGPLDASAYNYRQGYQQPALTSKVESFNEPYRNSDSPKPGSTVADGGSLMIERPKLNLKPRSQPLDQSDERFEKERQIVFGGARPRELVLKERGIDETASGNLDLGPALNRVDSLRNEATSERLISSTQRNPNTENHVHEKRTERNLDRKEQQTGREKNDNQGRNRRIESRWGSRDTDQQQRDLKPVPETWRKTVEEPKLSSDDASGINHGKVVSALDLAQAFSKSVSDPKTHEGHSTQRGLPGHNNQTPFSRLTDTRELKSAPTARHHISGY
ncbi:uncharacterized protein LOC116112511 [Pistacia vera]|uniref:uncharacterized protein LOC116112511 n=1 Tax=Pistacia vera TaxID=55513 RepID=UPI001262EA2C|nr:uncharacterized protein LOC116112511 [Pistacia vera]